MPVSIIYHFASGAAYFSGAALIALAAAGAFVDRTIVRILSTILAVIGIIVVALSSTPTAPWLYALALAIVALWLIVENTRRWRRSWSGKTWRVVVMLTCVALVAVESRWWIARPLAPGVYQRMYVLGDSISAEGAWEGEEFKAATITLLADGKSITLRDEWGRPMWSGAGRRAIERQNSQNDI